MMTPDEIERGRQLSVEALKQIDREEFDRWYQEQCDRDYWARGQCCAGCDRWISDMGRVGQCKAAGIVSAAEKMTSLGIQAISVPRTPGLPYTRGDFHCGLFKDEFDWSTLDAEYLERIGAMRHGELKPKPIHVREHINERR
ncbi:hypothetical protein [Paracoccus saliphilus]|uniref:Uncharacterized protein n=1 Tax=Paracoccus saliphilus TaxID=405559 RepID=A0AA46A7M2_9RHOB|nr:hypothetical protein [Paracoccus saliphilus]WCR02933.1 hypothetical protein JHX88_19345 [Paracoccus saliphilus]SIT15819.1 hypothetical protein SAMN05421772_1277 [Paracoccus saliphilus]